MRRQTRYRLAMTASATAITAAVAFAVYLLVQVFFFNASAQYDSLAFIGAILSIPISIVGSIWATTHTERDLDSIKLRRLELMLKQLHKCLDNPISSTKGRETDARHLEITVLAVKRLYELAAHLHPGIVYDMEALNKNWEMDGGQLLSIVRSNCTNEDSYVKFLVKREFLRGTVEESLRRMPDIMKG